MDRSGCGSGEDVATRTTPEDAKEHQGTLQGDPRGTLGRISGWIIALAVALAVALLIFLVFVSYEHRRLEVKQGHLVLDTHQPHVVAAVGAFDHLAYTATGTEALRVDLVHSPAGNGHGDKTYLRGGDHTLRTCDYTYAAWGRAAGRTNKESGHRLKNTDLYGGFCSPEIGQRNYNWHQTGYKNDSGFHWTGPRSYH